VGVFNKKKAGIVWEEFKKENGDFLKWKTKKPQGGESPLGVQKRMYDFLKELEKKYQGKKIVLVSHKFPLTVLEKTLEGMEMQEILKWSFERKEKRIQTGEFRRVLFKMIPFNKEMEIDLHRPYVDEVIFFCECGGLMKRRESVIDCWFDSGAMPFAQVHFPFSVSKNFEKINYKKLVKKIDFPADFIAEAIDQTRGWFYTLLAVSTALDLGPPFLNVISAGHILDEKGEKMSKSKGNIVDPWELIEKYSADTLRWYCYTINEPSDSKRFREQDFEKIFRNFILLSLNCWKFLNFYFKPKMIKNFSPKFALDAWIVSRLAFLSSFVKEKLSNYEITKAAREIERFLREDLSGWYIRRSRERLGKKEKKEVGKTLSFVFLNFSKILAPFCPFLAEYFFQGFLKKPFLKEKSVHLEEFPLFSKKLRKEKLEREMEEVLKIVSLVLSKRKEAKIKIRQPLSTLKIKKEIKNKELLSLLKAEVNVKKIIVDKKIKNDFELDLRITPELKNEGLLRELARLVQDLKKKQGFLPKDKIVLGFFGPQEYLGLLSENKKNFLRRTKIQEIEFLREEPKEKKEMFLEGKKIFLILRKINVRKN